MIFIRLAEKNFDITLVNRSIDVYVRISGTEFMQDSAVGKRICEFLAKKRGCRCGRSALPNFAPIAFPASIAGVVADRRAVGNAGIAA